MPNQFIGTVRQVGWFNIKITEGTVLENGAGFKYLYTFDIGDGRHGWFNTDTKYSKDCCYVISAEPNEHLYNVTLMDKPRTMVTHFDYVRKLKDLGAII